MATTTSNLGLTKPATTDKYNVSVQNGNMDIIDTAVQNIINQLKPVTIWEGSVTGQGGTASIGSIAAYERVKCYLGANGSYTVVEVPKSLYGYNIGVNWQAADNRLANYYVTFSITASGLITVLYGGYNRVDVASDYERAYGVYKVEGYKY